MSRRLPPRLLAALLAAADRLDAAGVEWLLTGSAARALAGFGARPRDIDLEVGPEDAERAAAILGAPLEASSADGRSSRRAIAVIAGAGVDLTCDLEVSGPFGLLEPDFALQRRSALRAELAGRAIWLAPVEETLARALVLGDWATLARVARQGAEGDAPAPRASYLSARLASAAASAAR